MNRLTRETRETRVRVALGAHGFQADDRGASGLSEYAAAGAAPAAAAVSAGAKPIRTGDAFFDHMLTTLACYAGFALDVDATADLRHHLIEDVAITLGLALRDEIAPDCNRFGEATVPMDDALVHAALDAGGRFYYQGPLPSSLYDHFLRSLAENARITLHVRVLRGRDRHHVVEAAFKAVGVALRQALASGDARASRATDEDAAGPEHTSSVRGPNPHTTAPGAPETAADGRERPNTGQPAAGAPTPTGERAVVRERTPTQGGAFSTKGRVRIERER